MKTQKLKFVKTIFILLVGFNTSANNPIDGQSYYIQSALGDSNLFLMETFQTRTTPRIPTINVFTNELGEYFNLIQTTGEYFKINPYNNDTGPNRFFSLTFSDQEIASIPNNNSGMNEWRFIETSDGYFHIQSKLGDRYLTVEGSVSESGTKVIATRSLQGIASKWRLFNVREPITFRREFNLDNIENLCPTRRLQGDEEFAGNGPHVTGRVRMAYKNNLLYAMIQFDAKETRSDWSHVRGEWVKNVLSLPGNWRINRIIYPNWDSSFDYITTRIPRLGFRSTSSSNSNLGLRGTNTMQMDGIVSEFDYVADTGGNDISNDNNCSDDTRVTRIQLKPITLELTYTPPQ